MENPDHQLPRPMQGENEQIFLARLEEAIRNKLLNHTEALFQILYRLDVSEEKVKSIMQSYSPELWPPKIAILIWEREKKRMEWKARFENKNGSA